MARYKDRENAIKLRVQGKSYSEIKAKLGVGKSTLSYWLRDYPLSQERIRELRDHNPRRIENFRETFRKKREARLKEVYKRVKNDIGEISDRDLFVSGLSLYWAEGTKGLNTVTSLSNTDPAVIKYFIRWLKLLGVKKDKLRVRLHLYSDMSIKNETNYWSKELNIPLRQFRKPYIKKTSMNRVYFKGGYGHGTCNVLFGSRELNDYVIIGIKYLRDTISLMRP